MHSSTLDTPSGALLSEHTSSSPSCSPGSTRDGGDLLVAVATLVTEGRIPIIPGPSKRCSAQLTNNQSSPSCNGAPQQHHRGFFEGPHCFTSMGSSSSNKGPASSPQRNGSTMSGGGVGMQGVAGQHFCNPTDVLCQKYEKVRSEVLNLWQKGIPLCVEVFLKHTCSCDVSLDIGTGSLLLERWYLSVSHFRSTAADMSSSSNSPPATFNNFNQLISAIRSQLYFSQISAWLSPSSAPATRPLSFHYRLAIPGETFDASTFSCQQPPHTHTFPSTDMGNGLLLNLQLESLPRVDRIPAVKCDKCGGGDAAAERVAVVAEDEARRSASPAEGSPGCALFDDRMHTRCTLKGKHRCDDLDDFDSNLVSKSEQQVLGGKYKRLCHNDAGEKRSPQRAAFSSSTTAATSVANRRLPKNNNNINCCDCQQPQLPSTSSSSSPTSSSSSNNANKNIGGSGFEAASTSKESSPAKSVNKGIRFCYQAFSDVFVGPGLDGAVLDGTIADGIIKGGVEALNQNEKRNSVQPDVQEPHKTPKLDLGDRVAPLEINVPAGLAVIPIDLNKQQQKSPPSTATANSNTHGDFLVNSILRTCRLEPQINQNSTEQQQQQATGNNNNNINNNAVDKCDVKCVQRLGRIGTNILHGCARALQTVSDNTTCTTTSTSTTTNGDIFNLSHNGKVNNTVYIDERTCCTSNQQQTDKTDAQKSCRMRDISNTHLQQISQSINNKLVNNKTIVQYNNPQQVRRRITFDDDEVTTKKHADSPIPRLPTSRFNFPAASSNVCQKLSFDSCADSPATSTATSAASVNSIEIPSPLDKAQFRKSLDNAASMVFHARTGLPLTSSPAPVRRGNTCFDYDSTIDSVSAIKSALFSGSFSTDDDSESDGSIVSPCSPDTFLSQPQAASYYSHATVLTENHHHHVKYNNRFVLPSTNSPSTVQQQPLNHHHHGNNNRRKTTSSSHLLGTFEESALNGRLEPAATVHGFKAELGASGSFVPPHRIVPVTVFFYTFGDSDKVSSPYLGHINLGKKGYNVPRTGTVQVTLFNPLGTVVKMFVIMYDLADMPNNSQTFIRQRTLYMPTNCKDTNLEWGPKWLRYLIHLRFMSSKSGKIYLHSDIRMIIFRKCDLDTATAHGMDMCYELRSFTHMPQNPKYSLRK